jgi:HNH endonuclease
MSAEPSQELTVESGLCHCGCGQPTPIATRTKSKRGEFAGQPKRFILGHCNRGRTMGKQAFCVSGGRTYVMSRGRDGVAMLYSRVLMWNEIGREPRPDEIVHHINEDPTDDRIENLEVVSRSKHLAIHRPKTEAVRIEAIGKALRKRVTVACAGCGKEFGLRPFEIRDGRRYCSTACTGFDRQTGVITQGRRARKAA